MGLEDLRLRVAAERNPQFVLNLLHWLSGLLDSKSGRHHGIETDFEGTDRRRAYV